MIQTASRYNVVVCGRRWGKTILGEDRAIGPALEGRPVGWFAPTYKILDPAFEELRHILKPVTARSDATRRTINLVTGGRIEMWSLEDEDAGRSRKYGRVVIDEAAQVSKLASIWSMSIRPTLVDYKGDAWFLSTPRGENYFHELHLRGLSGADPDYATWRMPSATNPHLDPGEIEAARGDMGSLEFSQEFLAEFVSQAGDMFRREWFNFVDVAPPGLATVRCWDLAGTEYDARVKGHDPDWTAGALVGRSASGEWYIIDVVRLRGSAGSVEEAIRTTAETDGRSVPVHIEQEPGAAGKSIIEHYQRRVLPGHVVRAMPASGDKATRAMPLAGHAEHGRVHLVRGEWCRGFLDEIVAFPGGLHDDQVDAAAMGVAALTTPQPSRRLVSW